MPTATLPDENKLYEEENTPQINYSFFKRILGGYKDILSKFVLKFAADILDQFMTMRTGPSRITNFTYFGYNGGALGDVREIIGYRDARGQDIILGFRNYDEEKGEKPLEYLSELTFYGGNILRGVEKCETGRLVSPIFDGHFEAGGSATELTAGDYDDTDERDILRRFFVDEDIRYSIARLPRRFLLRDDGRRSDVYVIEIPTARGYKGFFRILDPRGYDLGRIWYRTVQTLTYKFVDKFYDIFVEGPVRAYNKLAEKRGVRKMRLDPLINSEIMRTFSVIDYMFGLPPKLIYATK